jgi:predicted metal-dependent hydrolase
VALFTKIFFPNKTKVKLPEVLTLGEQTVPLIVRKTPRAKRLTLRLQFKKQNQVILTAPDRTSANTLSSFIERSLPWLEKQILQDKPRQVYRHGMSMTILDKSYELRHKTSPSFCLWWGEDYLLIHAPAEKLGYYVKKALYQTACQFLQSQTLDYASQIDKTVKRVTVRDTRSRWGSCTGQGNISYSWRLIFAPMAVAKYVCAHEVAHLIEMNHSVHFWNIVKNLCPDYKLLRQWLRQNGTALFQYEME